MYIQAFKDVKHFSSRSIIWTNSLSYIIASPFHDLDFIAKICTYEFLTRFCIPLLVVSNTIMYCWNQNVSSSMAMCILQGNSHVVGIGWEQYLETLGMDLCSLAASLVHAPCQQDCLHHLPPCFWTASSTQLLDDGEHTLLLVHMPPTQRNILGNCTCTWFILSLIKMPSLLSMVSHWNILLQQVGVFYFSFYFCM